MKKVFIVTKQYGNPEVFLLKKGFTKLDEAIQYAREQDKKTLRTYAVYSVRLDSKLDGDVEEVWCSTDEWWHGSKGK